MSIRNSNTYINITNLNNGEVEVIHDYFKITDPELKRKLLDFYLHDYIENKIDFTINYR